MSIAFYGHARKFDSHEHTTQSGNKYYTVIRNLGYREGKVPNNIYSSEPQNIDKQVDLLAIWDEGYGGLNIPRHNCSTVFWASDKSLPDREQFNKIADKCFLFLDADVLRDAGGNDKPSNILGAYYHRAYTRAFAKPQLKLSVEYTIHFHSLRFRWRSFYFE